MLARLHEMVLRAVAQAGPNCRAAQVQEIVGGFVGREASFGSIFTTLDRIGDKGMVTYRKGEPDARRGGRAPRLYTITDAGIGALDEAARLSLAMRNSSPGHAPAPGMGDFGAAVG